jgi:hypothetical protein
MKRMKARREESPKYKKFMEMTEKMNEQAYNETITTELTKMNISQETVTKYKYFGGNHNEHLTYFDNQIHTFIKNGITVGNIEEYIRDDCDACNRKTTNKILLLDEDNMDMLCICNRCCSKFGKMPKKKGICEDCGNKHYNRSDNYCDECRKKSNCLKCGKRNFCYNGYCICCISKYNFCVDCNRREVSKKGLRCSACYNKLKKCECGNPITKSGYKTCYLCYSSKFNRQLVSLKK